MGPPAKRSRNIREKTKTKKKASFGGAKKHSNIFVFVKKLVSQSYKTPKTPCYKTCTIITRLFSYLLKQVGINRPQTGIELFQQQIQLS